MRKLVSLGLGAALMLASTGAFAQAPTPAPAKPVAPPAAAAPAPAAPAAKPARLLDINTATQAELEALPGIGKARSEAIVKGRPYGGKDDLLNRGIVPQNVYAGVKDQIVAKQPTKH